MQYSLIPTPLSFWGKPYLAGKTENCMCHPDYRGKGQYLRHEQESFEEAKKKFDVFFTTAGDVSKGTVGAIRRKLGYTSLDAWTLYVFCLKPKYIMGLVHSKLKQKGKMYSVMVRCLFSAISQIACIYFRLNMPQKPLSDIKIFNKHEVPMNEIESFWDCNKTSYMITVDRSSSYLEWRINQNPYHDYKYLLYYKDNRLVGYAIFSLNKANAILITDILVEKGDMSLFKIIVSRLIWYAKDVSADAVLFSTLSKNALLNNLFSRIGFIDFYKLKMLINNHENLNAFHVYVSSGIDVKQNPIDPRNWYITELVSEGRL